MDPLTRLYSEIGGAILIVAVGIGLWVHHDTVEQAKGAATCYQKVTETQYKASSDAKDRELNYQAQLAQAKKDKDDALANLPAPIRTPVFVRVPGTVCSSSPGQAPKADSVHTDAGGNGQGSGVSDIRPGLEAFKVRYGRSLLDCKEVLADYPP